MAKKKKLDEEDKPETSDGSIAVNDAWTGMLAVSLLALVIGSGFLFYDWYFLYPDSAPAKPPSFISTPPGPLQKEKGPGPKVDPNKDAGAKDGKDAAAKDADKKEPEKKAD
jgi:hypothetical protein